MRYILLTILFILPLQLLSQESNFELVKSAFNTSAAEITTNIKKNDVPEFSLNISDHPANWLLEQKILENAEKKGLKIISDSGNILSLNIAELKVTYSLYEDGDSLRRKIECGIYARINTAEGMADVSPDGTLILTDVIPYDDALLLQSDGYDFTNGNIPEKENGFFEEYIEPIIITSAAVMSVVLFFTIRSN